MKVWVRFQGSPCWMCCGHNDTRDTFFSDYVKFLLLITILLMIHIASSVIFGMVNRTIRRAAVSRDVLVSQLEN